jgi:hypothetical protein
MACRWCVWGECWYHGGGGWSDGTLRCAQCGKAKQVNDFSRNPRSKGSARLCQCCVAWLHEVDEVRKAIPQALQAQAMKELESQIKLVADELARSRHYYYRVDAHGAMVPNSQILQYLKFAAPEAEELHITTIQVTGFSNDPRKRSRSWGPHPSLCQAPRARARSGRGCTSGRASTSS